MSDMKRLGILIPATLDTALREVHERTGIPISRLVRDGILKELARYGSTPTLAPIQVGGDRRISATTANDNEIQQNTIAYARPKFTPVPKP